MVFLYVQTVWEGAWTNTFENGLVDLDDFGIRGAYGFDPMGDEYPATMRMFQTNGTPWHVILDREGNELYSGFSPNTVNGLTDVLAEQVGEE